MTKAKTLAPLHLESKMLQIRGERVMLDRDLAEVYGVTTVGINQAIKRNRDRFPEGFVFRLTPEEAEDVRRSRSQSVIMKRGWQRWAFRSKEWERS